MKTLLASMLGVCILITTQAYAIDFGGRLSVGGGGGRTFPVGPKYFKGLTDEGSLWEAHLKYGLIDDLSLILSYSNMLLDDKTTGLDTQFQPLVVGAQYHPFHQWAVSPYLMGGIGASFNNSEHLTIIPGSFLTKRWTRFTAQVGAGFEYFLIQGTSIGFETKYYYFGNTGSIHTSPFGLVTVAGMLNIYFGEGARVIQARSEAEKARGETEAARSEAKRQKEAAEETLRQANLAKQQGELAKREALEAKIQAGVAEKATAEAKIRAEAAEKAAAEAKERALTAKLALSQAEASREKAQAELNKIKEIVASKDISPITFKYARSEVTLESYPILDMVEEIAAKYPDLKLRVEGHTDDIGNDASNLRLSQQRAESVKNYLVQPGKLNHDQVVAVGFGESQPIAANNSKQGRSLNRRVEFIFIIK